MTPTLSELIGKRVLIVSSDHSTYYGALVLGVDGQMIKLTTWSGSEWKHVNEMSSITEDQPNRQATNASIPPPTGQGRPL